MRKQSLLMVLLITLLSGTAKADEGMWIPVLIEKYNIRIMQENGFKLTAEDIYSINKASMKDAVVLFGGGCTGEFISDKGLILTNHHCGFGSIQNHSTLEHDYLNDGFWASTKDEELSNPGLSVTIMKYMEDVTKKVLEGVTDDMDAEKREALINANITAINAGAVRGTHYSSMVMPFFLGNQYFLIVNEVFRDVRLVGAPPSAIGKFGGDTDNWVWPRHTGDFSLFRVYADSSNKPAAYSAGNVPYKPAWHFTVSLKGVNEGDFTMVFGYPARTQEYAPSNHIRMLKDVIYPKQVEIRGTKIAIMEQEMAGDPLVRIKYSTKAYGLSNGWKKWIGEIQSLDKINGIARKEAFEKEFSDWAAADQVRTAKYGTLFGQYDEIYKTYSTLSHVNNYTSEVFFNDGVEPAGLANSFRSAVKMAGAKSPDLEKELTRLQSTAADFFKDYDDAVAKRLFVAVMDLYGKNIAPEWQSQAYKELYASCNGNFQSVTDKMFTRSIFTDEKKVRELLGNFDCKEGHKGSVLYSCLFCF